MLGTLSWRDAGLCTGKSPFIRSSNSQRRTTSTCLRCEDSKMSSPSSGSHVHQKITNVNLGVSSGSGSSWLVSAPDLIWYVCEIIRDWRLLSSVYRCHLWTSQRELRKTPQKSSLCREDCASDSVVLRKLYNKIARDVRHRYEKYSKITPLKLQISPATDSLRIYLDCYVRFQCRKVKMINKGTKHKFDEFVASLGGQFVVQLLTMLQPAHSKWAIRYDVGVTGAIQIFPGIFARSENVLSHFSLKRRIFSLVCLARRGWSVGGENVSPPKSLK